MEQQLQESTETYVQAFVETHEPVLAATSGRGVANPRRTRLVTAAAEDRGPTHASD